LRAIEYALAIIAWEASWPYVAERAGAPKQPFRGKARVRQRVAAPGADLQEENRFHCNDGPIRFALDAISQWHKQLTFVIRYLHTMEAAPAYSPLEYTNAYGTADHSQIPAPDTNNRGSGSRTAQATAHAATEGTSSSKPSRAQHKRAADQSAPTRCEEHPAAGDSHSVPREARRDVGCECCGMRGHTASQCRSNRHPNWNAQHATVR
jgi:hypothetical protein